MDCKGGMKMLRSYYDKSLVKTKKQLFTILDEIHKEAGIKDILIMRFDDVHWVNRKATQAVISLKQKIKVEKFFKEVEVDTIKICLGETYTKFGVSERKHFGRKEIEKMKRWIKEWAEKNGIAVMER